MRDVSIYLSQLVKYLFENIDIILIQQDKWAQEWFILLQQLTRDYCENFTL